MSDNKLRVEKTIWILEDDPGACFIYEESLGLRYSLQFYDSLAKIRSKLQQNHIAPDLMIVDLRLPDGNFLEFLERGEEWMFADHPFIVVSSMDDLDVLRTCFKIGALDYLTKPFTKNELIVKIERILCPSSNSFNLRHAGVTIDAITSCVSKGLTSIHLTAKELQIFSCLYKAHGEAVTRKRLISSVWGTLAVSEKTLDVHLLNLRRKIKKLDLEIHFIEPGSFQLSDC